MVQGFTPLATITRVSSSTVVEASRTVKKWVLEIRGQSKTICSCKVPLCFIDVREEIRLVSHYPTRCLSRRQPDK
jgi:hypothetical protein